MGGKLSRERPKKLNDLHFIASERLERKHWLNFWCFSRALLQGLASAIKMPFYVVSIGFQGVFRCIVNH